jgi:hypothetical protein
MRNRCCYWAQLPTNSRGEYTTSAKVAEGEELGSNLLRVAKSGLWVRAVPLEVHDPGQNGRRLKESQTAVPGDHPASTWHWDPCQTHIEPPD